MKTQERGLVPLFFFLYIGHIPGFPAFLTVPADDMQTERPQLTRM